MLQSRYPIDRTSPCSSVWSGELRGFITMARKCKLCNYRLFAVDDWVVFRCFCEMLVSTCPRPIGPPSQADCLASASCAYPPHQHAIAYKGSSVVRFEECNHYWLCMYFRSCVLGTVVHILCVLKGIVTCCCYFCIQFFFFKKKREIWMFLTIFTVWLAFATFSHGAFG